MRVNGFETVRVNSKNPAETSPRTPSTRARNVAGRLPPATATAKPHSERMRHHSRMEPS